MVVLLLNLKKFPEPKGKYDPTDNSQLIDTTPTSDLNRMKYYRNLLVHTNDGNFSSTAFSEAWEDISGVRLHLIFLLK